MSTSKRPDLTRDRAAVAAVTALVISNVVTNRRLPLTTHVPWSLGMAAGLIGLARVSGCSLEELGLDRRHLRPSIGVGAATARAVAAGYTAIVTTGVGRGLFLDRRVLAMSRGQALWHLLFGIPITTVLTEEVAFRGVLPALLDSPRRPRWLPELVPSLLFGVWHVLPSWEGSRANQSGRGASALAIVLHVGATTVGGGLLHLLRRRTGHLAAPAALHLAANVFGFVTTRRMTGR